MFCDCYTFFFINDFLNWLRTSLEACFFTKPKNPFLSKPNFYLAIFVLFWGFFSNKNILKKWEQNQRSPNETCVNNDYINAVIV